MSNENNSTLSKKDAWFTIRIRIPTKDRLVSLAGTNIEKGRLENFDEVITRLADGQDFYYPELKAEMYPPSSEDRIDGARYLQYYVITTPEQRCDDEQEARMLEQKEIQESEDATHQEYQKQMEEYWASPEGQAEIKKQQEWAESEKGKKWYADMQRKHEEYLMTHIQKNQRLDNEFKEYLDRHRPKMSLEKLFGVKKESK